MQILSKEIWDGAWNSALLTSSQVMCKVWSTDRTWGRKPRWCYLTWCPLSTCGCRATETRSVQTEMELERKAGTDSESFDSKKKKVKMTSYYYYCWVASVVSDSVRPQRRQPTRLPHPWGSPGKNTGVGCHFLLQCMEVKRESEVAQSCPTLREPMDCSPPGSSIHGIFQARVLEWGAIAFSKMTS